MKYSIHIDYVTLSLPDSSPNYNPQQIFEFILPDYHEYALQHEHAQSVGGRTPFNRSYQVGGVTVFNHDRNYGAIIEIGGKACQVFGQGYLLSLCENFRVTRLDIACDIESQLSPFDVITKKPTSTFDTSSGITVYHGSMKSDCYSRIYRYHEPHPRANMLRFETVFKSRYVPSVIAAIRSGKIQGVVAKRAKKVGFDLLDFGELADYRLAPIETRNSGKVTWIIKQVMPSLRKLVNDGTIADIDSFLDEHLYRYIKR